LGVQRIRYGTLDAGGSKNIIDIEKKRQTTIGDKTFVNITNLDMKVINSKYKIKTD